MGVNIKSYLGVGIDMLSYIKEHKLDYNEFSKNLNEKVNNPYFNNNDTSKYLSYYDDVKNMVKVACDGMNGEYLMVIYIMDVLYDDEDSRELDSIILQDDYSEYKKTVVDFVKEIFDLEISENDVLLRIFTHYS